MRTAISLSAGLVVAGCGAGAPPSPLSIDGVYTLRIETTCAALPADVRVRTYVATIGGQRATLSGATFWMHPSRDLLNQFRISAVDGNQVALALNLPDTTAIKGIVEETAPGIYLELYGTGGGTVSEAGGVRTIAGTFSSVVAWGADLIDDARHTGCAAGNHTATFRFTSGAAAVGPPGIASTFVRVRVEGPPAVAPGQREAFRAVGELPDGSTRDVTNLTRFDRMGFAISVTPDGSVTGLSVGESKVTAAVAVPNFGTLGNSREVIVVPPGTVRVAGTVTSGSPAQPVAGATVIVDSGPSAGLSAITDWDGRFALYGVSGESRIRFTKPGYEDRVQTVDGSTHPMLSVSLPQLAPIPDVSGRYTMTITADPQCGSPMPPPFDVRTYTAVIAQNGRELTVSLSGASFFIREGRGAGFPGQADPAQLTFRLDDNFHFDDGGNPDVVEQLGGARVLFVFGDITTSIAPGRLTGTLKGSLQFADRALPSNGFFWGASCDSERHQVVFSR